MKRFEDAKKKFKEMPNGKRTSLILGGAAILTVVLFSIFDNSKPDPKKLAKPIQLEASTQPSGLDPEQVTAEQARMREQLRMLEERGTTQKPGGSADQLSEVETLKRRIEELETRQKTGPEANLTAPTMPKAELSVPPPAPQDPAASNEQSKIRIIRSENPRSLTAEEPKVPVAYLPAGSNFEAVLLNGMDANAGVNGDKNPTPALLRIKTDAILPNLFSQDVKECFILVAGSGDVSSERALLRTETISCVDTKTGKAFEGKAEGYVVGEDGKVGVRGRLVSRDGQLLMKSLTAGFISGVGGAFTPMATPTVNFGSNGNQSGSAQSYQYPTGDYVLGSGVTKGLQTAGQQLAQYYIKMAEKMYPVVEIDANRKVTVILIKGMEVKK